MKKSILTIIIISILIMIYSTPIVESAIDHGDDFKLIKGEVDLTDFEFDSGKSVNLFGEVEFYWQQFINSKSETKVLSSKFVTIPSLWNEYDVVSSDGGFASYKMILHMNTKENLSLYIDDILTSYRIYWNGELLGGLGITSAHEKVGKPSNHSSIYSLKATQSTNELVIEVSDYHLGKGGINSLIKISRADIIKEQNTRSYIAQVLITATFLALFTVLVLESLVMGIQKPNASLAFIFLVMALRAFATGDRMILYVFKNLSWHGLYLIETLTLILIIPVFIRVMSSLAKSDITDKVLIVASRTSRVAIVLLLLMKPIHTIHFIQPFILFNFILMLIMLFIILKRHLLKGFSDKLLLFSMVIVVFVSGYQLTFGNIVSNRIDFVNLSFVSFGFMAIATSFLKSFEIKKNEQVIKEQLTVKNQLLLEANETLESRIKERTKGLERANIQLLELSKRDSLTNLLNHKAFMEVVELSQNIVERRKLSLVMIDIDEFKQVNDTFGHQIGDQVLIELSAIFVDQLRPDDVIGRYGGEEFIALIYNSTAEESFKIMYRILERVRTNLFTDKEIKVTFSAGIEYSSGTKTISEVIRLADIKLYEAKDKGRNRIVY